VISRNPVTIQLRYLQTLLEIGGKQSTTIVFPLPIDLIGGLMQAAAGNGAVTAPPPRGKSRPADAGSGDGSAST